MCDSLRQDPQDAVSDDVGQEAALAARIPAEPDITLARLQDWLGDRHDGWLSSGGLWAAVKRLGFTFKKNPAASEQVRPDVAARRAGWSAAQPFIDPQRLAFIDETRVNTKMTRLYGSARRGERVKGAAPFGHWKTMTFVAVLRLDGITAPVLLDGAMDGEAFRLYVERVLARAQAWRHRRHGQSAGTFRQPLDQVAETTSKPPVPTLAAPANRQKPRFGWGTWIRTRAVRSRAGSSTAKLSPMRDGRGF